MKLVAYVRVSRIGGRAGESFISPKVQRDAIEAYARANGHEIVALFEDLDQTGGKLDRPGLNQARAMVAAKEADGIIAAKLDRLTRSLAGLGRLLDDAKAGGWNLIAIDVGLDMNAPNGELVAGVLGSVAQFERSRRREDWDIAQGNAVARGIHIASRTPTGYTRRDQNPKTGRPAGPLVLDPKAAPVIHDLFVRRAAGSGWRALADFMNETGIVGPYGNERWTAGAVSKIIRNRVYLGEARSGRHVNANAHSAIVSRGEWEAAQGPKVGRSPRVGEGLLLAGLVRCAGCRYLMKADHMRDRHGERLGFYRCRARHAAGTCSAQATVLARVLDPFIEAALLDEANPVALASASTAELDSASNALDAAETELAAYRDANFVSIVGREFYVAGLEQRAKAVDEARGQLAQLQRRGRLHAVPDTPGALRDAWATLSIAERRELLGSAIDAIFVRSGREPIAQRALILWRGEAPNDLPRRGQRFALASFDW